MKLINLNQFVSVITASATVAKAGSATLFILSLIIVWQLISHGQAALGIYMLIGNLLEKYHHQHASNETGEHVVHIVAHTTKTH
jgi:hypothetical protein